MISLLKVTLTDQLLERVRRNFADAIAELQKLPFVFARVHQDKTLADGQTTFIAHKLGRPPLIALVSPVRGAVSSGRIEEVRDSTVDRDQFVALKAVGYAGPVVIDLVVL